MAFKYACFISYCHGQHALVQSFIDQLKDALKAALDPYLDEQVYIDYDRLKPGFNYTSALERALCESVCMVLVYSPRYERHAYCGREFQGMESLEAARLKCLGAAADSRGLIIPVILRGADEIPERIKKDRLYADFSRFTLATQDLSRNPEYVSLIEDIAAEIYKHYKRFETVGGDVCGDCSTFVLPAESQLKPWRAAVAPGWAPVFPNRA
jgi:TIR domain